MTTMITIMITPIASSMMIIIMPSLCFHPDFHEVEQLIHKLSGGMGKIKPSQIPSRKDSPLDVHYIYIYIYIYIYNMYI